jgi:L-asparaginase II
MTITGGRIVSKGGAEGYQGMGLLPGALAKDSPALGIAIKISDGDPKDRAISAVSLEVLRQLEAISSGEVDQLTKYGPTFPVQNWRKLTVGEARPCFKLNRQNGRRST